MKCDFTIHGGQVSGYAIGVCNSNGSERASKGSVCLTSGNTISFIVPEFEEGDTQIYLAVWLYLNRSGQSGSAAQNDYTDFTNITVTIDDEDMTWEEYTGGNTSPNSEYKQSINSAGDNLNLFNKEEATSSALQADGTILSSSTLTTSDFIEISPIETYYKTITASARVKLYDKNKSVISTSSVADISNFGNAQSFSIPSGFETAKYIRITMENQYVDTFKLEKGTKGSAYSPYGMGSITEKIANNNYVEYQEQNYTILTQQPMRSIGNVRDKFVNENGNRFERHNIYRYIFTGEETFQFRNYGNNKINSEIALFSFTLPFYYSQTNNNEYLKSNCFMQLEPVTGYSVMYNKDVGLSVYKNPTSTSTSGNTLYINTIIAKNVTEFKAYLAEQYANGTPVYADFILRDYQDKR